MWYQQTLTLGPKSRGFHLVTDEIVRQLPELERFQVGLVHLFIQHTSASLTLNENADPTVRQDFESVFNRLVPQDQPYYRHNYEGSDDLPAHIKSCLLGRTQLLPIRQGALALGIW